MTLLVISFLAGIFTVLAPCILPLLPIVVGSSMSARSKATPFLVIGSLALSILLFTYLLKASTVFITIPQYVWGYISGAILIGFGLVLLFPQLWEQLSFTAKTNRSANKLVGAGHQKQSAWGDVMVGAALGPVFSSCSPTYFVILATVLPASFLLGTIYLFAYIAGLVLVLALIAILGQRLTQRLQFAAESRSWLKRGVGVLFLIVGIFIATGLDKTVETWMLDNGYLEGVLDFEQELLNQAEPIPRNTQNATTSTSIESQVDVPATITRSFPRTDFRNVDAALADAVSGGPGKDGIPAIDSPKFIPLREVSYPDSVRAIVLSTATTTKVYPYNILIWHEIVNDTFAGTPVAITFCPLCGSAIVYNRTLPNDTVSTFGVSGALLESNMIMYDRKTENLWQQSTGKTLAGSLHPAELDRVSFQLLTLGDVRSAHPEAMVLSEETGYERNYARNPYAGYENSDEFIFTPDNLDTTFAPKTIMAVFSARDTVVATPWRTLRDTGRASTTIDNVTYELSVTDTGELSVRNQAGESPPFYFEMWFSVAAQNKGDLQVLTP
jgi:cytochrome c biogenesis protein CcdA